MSNDGVHPGERHESLYFMDGNVVLLAPRLEQPPLLFRVHKSVLSSHSPIFSDMFDVCSPSDTDNSEADRSYDGVPLIHMPDNANHLESVLKILYYQSTLPWTPRSPHYPALVTPILELSRKYGIDRMHEQIVRHLESDWPQTLKDWDKLESDIEFMANSPGVQRVDDHFPEPASAIKLAHKFDIPSILPAAFYHLSRLSILDDWDKKHADLPLLSNRTKRTAQWGLLSGKDFRCLLIGKAEFQDILRGSTKTGEFRHGSNSRAWDSDDCECDLGEGVWKDICDKWLQSADPLATLKSSVKFEGNKVQNCLICTRAVKAKISVVRTQTWERLGDLFHLRDE